MTTRPDSRQKSRDLTRVASAAFVVALVLTAGMLWLGFSGAAWPRWLLALTTVL